MSRCRYWSWTENNPNEPSEVILERCQAASDFKYVIFQLEEGEVNKVRHYQGYIEFTKPKRLGWLKAHINDRAHFERRKRTAEQARDYCRKEAGRLDGPWESGAWDPKSVGQRTDLQTGVEAVARGGLDQLVDEAPELFVKYNRGFTALAQHYGAKREREYEDVVVKLAYGVPGCGKTRSVMNEFTKEDLYIHEPGSPWFDGYTGQACVLLDDFAGSASGFRLDKTLVLLDKYRCRLPVKGGHTYLVADTVWLTTNIHPIYWFKWKRREVQYRALARRIDEVYIWEGDERVLLADNAVKQFWDLDDMEPYGTTWGDITVPMPQVDGYDQ